MGSACCGNTTLFPVRKPLLDPIPNFTKGKIRIENQRRFSVFLFPTLKSIASTLEANAALVGRKIFDFKTMGKKVIERHTEKLLIYAAIRSIGKRGEKARLFP